jgi:hypothetical protein
MPSGITFLGKHSYNDFGITMPPTREIGIPNKKKTKLTLPFSNVTYDYSSIFGSQTYEERTLKYTFNISGRSIRTKEEMNWLKTTVINWLMNSDGKQPLYDDNYPGMHFLAEVEGNASFTENWNFGYLEVTFTAYPFMISDYPEGTDVWDNFNFLFDVVQDVKFDIPPSGYDFKELAIGSQATLGAWAVRTAGGTQNDLVNYVGVTGTITAKQDITPYSYSTRTYTVTGFDDPIYEQDIIQACNQYVDAVLINPGTPSVFPELTITRTHTGAGDATPKVSIENKDTGVVYNFVGSNPVNYLFELKSGENNLRIYYGLEDPETIEFTFSKELL